MGRERSAASESVRTLVAGVGYSYLSDLSLGPILVSRLQAEEWPSHIEVEDLSYHPIAVVQRLEEAAPAYERLVLVGAADRSLPPPSLRCYRWDRVLPDAEEVQSRVAEALTGVIDLDQFLVVAEQFGALPAEVFVVEIQPAVTEHGLEVSPAIGKILPAIASVVRRVAESPRGEIFCTVSGLGGLASTS